MLRKRNVHKNNVARRFAGAKAQSAMEYLMTYGWAILIIAVVLGALFQLGVFNANNFAPKAPPGACQVFRPNGPGTTSFINLEGICSGELPQYTLASYGGTASITVQNNNLLNFNTFTVTLWLDQYQASPYSTCCCGAFNLVEEPNRFQIYREWAQGMRSVTIWVNNATKTIWTQSNDQLPLHSWHFIAAEYDGKTVSIYIDGANKSYNQLEGPLNPVNSQLLIGYSYPCQNVNGSLSNIQIYNTSLSANEIQTLYLEGIGGAPIDLQHLVAWWPLNGNANDYSGNGNNGAPTNVIFVSNWWSDYTPP